MAAAKITFPAAIQVVYQIGLPAALMPKAEPVASLPADAGILKATFAEYLSMTPDARMEFARFGGRMAKSDFEKLSPAAKTSFCVNGGKILEDRTFVKSPSGSLGRWE